MAKLVKILNMTLEENIKLEITACDLCSGSEYKFLYSMPDLRFRCYELEYSAVECEQCGHRFLSPRPTIDSFPLIYPENYYAGRSSQDSRQQKRYFKQISYLPSIKSGKLLDVGCAGGGWLKVAQEYGWDCYGADFVESSYKETGINIRYGDLLEIDYPASFFDVVCAWGVMEHIHKPSRYFQQIHRLLKDKGVFIFMVPNGNSLWSRWAYGEDIPRHLHFFRPKILSIYADKFGYRVKKIEFTNKIYSRPATGRGMFRKRLLRKAGVSWDESIGVPLSLGHKLIGKVGSILDYCLIQPKFEELFGLCGNMVVIFKKETDKEKNNYFKL